MKLSTLLSINKELIFTQKAFTTKEEIIEHMLSAISKKYNKEKSFFADPIYRREEVGGTAFEEGIALPHAKFSDFDDFIISVMTLKEPVVFHDTLFPNQDLSIRMVMMLITPSHMSAFHLNALSIFSGVARGKPEGLFQNLLDAKTGDEFIKFIEKAGIDIKKDLTVADIMSYTLVTCNPDDTVKMCVDLLFEKKVKGLYVTDENNNIIGEISEAQIIQKGIPSYASMIGNISFLKTAAPFEDFLKNEDKIYAKEVMKTDFITISTDASVLEASFAMVKNNVRRIAVVENGKIQGVVTMTDIIRKVMRV